MKKDSLLHAGHFDPPYALEVSRPSVPLPEAGNGQIRG
jgi:hypothetical protein